MSDVNALLQHYRRARRNCFETICGLARPYSWSILPLSADLHPSKTGLSLRNGSTVCNDFTNWIQLSDFIVLWCCGYDWQAHTVLTQMDCSLPSRLLSPKENLNSVRQSVSSGVSFQTPAVSQHHCITWRMLSVGKREKMSVLRGFDLLSPNFAI